MGTRPAAPPTTTATRHGATTLDLTHIMTRPCHLTHISRPHRVSGRPNAQHPPTPREFACRSSTRVDGSAYSPRSPASCLRVGAPQRPAPPRPRSPPRSAPPPPAPTSPSSPCRPRARRRLQPRQVPALDHPVRHLQHPRGGPQARRHERRHQTPPAPPPAAAGTPRTTAPPGPPPPTSTSTTWSRSPRPGTPAPSSWTTAQRQSFANDLTRPQLIAVTDNVNQSKSDQDPAEWMPRARRTTARTPASGSR